MILETYDYSLEFDVRRLRVAATNAFRLLDGIVVQAWPDMEEWLDDLVPESLGPDKHALRVVRTLDEKVLKRMLSAELTTLYGVDSSDAFAAVLLAALRHSELTATFFPLAIGERYANRLILAADYYEIQAEGKCDFPQVEWLMGMGLVDDESDRLTLMTESKELMVTLGQILLAPPDGEGVFRRSQTEVR